MKCILLPNFCMESIVKNTRHSIFRTLVDTSDLSLKSQTLIDLPYIKCVPQETRRKFWLLRAEYSTRYIQSEPSGFHMLILSYLLPVFILQTLCARRNKAEVGLVLLHNFTIPLEPLVQGRTGRKHPINTDSKTEWGHNVYQLPTYHLRITADNTSDLKSG